jgi:uncharacterized protein
MLTEDERAVLLATAREAIRANLVGGTRVSVAAEDSSCLRLPGAAFVTLHVGGELRGCIGHLEVQEPLLTVVARCAVAASSDDPRFAPISSEELPAARIEISVLGPLEQIEDPSDFQVGRHGLLVSQGRLRGLLLPQVAAGRHWDPATFLTQTCLKAGLEKDAWRKGARVFRFEAEIFGEPEEAGRLGLAGT